jgi:ribosomal protein S6
MIKIVQDMGKRNFMIKNVQDIGKRNFMIKKVQDIGKRNFTYMIVSFERCRTGGQSP